MYFHVNKLASSHIYIMCEYFLLKTRVRDMAKVWKDANEIIKQAEVPKKLWKFECEMKKKPKFEKVEINLKNINKKEGKPRIK